MSGPPRSSRLRSALRLGSGIRWWPISLALVAAAFLLACAGLRHVPAGPAKLCAARLRGGGDRADATKSGDDDASRRADPRDMLDTVSPDARVVRLFGPGQSHLSFEPTEPMPRMRLTR